MDLHEQAGLGPGFFSLWNMEVHLITVKVSVVGRTDGRVEPEGLVREDSDAVCHDGHSVEARLPVEEHNIAIPEVSLDDKAWLKRFRDNFSICNEFEPDPSAIGTDNV